MKLSCVIPVLNSHEVVRRQILHWSRLQYPAGEVEFIILDDGSDPPLWFTVAALPPLLNLSIIPTNDSRPWTWAVARNRGAGAAVGEYLLMTDIDHIITQQCLDAALNFAQDKLRFHREFGVLDENGHVTQDLAVLRQHGLPEARIAKRGVKLTALRNNFCMRRDLFLKLGGYREDLIGKAYPAGEDRYWAYRWHVARREGLVQEATCAQPTLLMFPNGYYVGDVDADPQGLFHKLSRKSERNPKHHA